MEYNSVVDVVSKVIDAAGIAVIVIGTITVSISFARRFLGRGLKVKDPYRMYRKGVGRSILLGLELLIAGDIIRPVAVDATWTNVGILGLLVIIRTVISVEMEMGILGCWPWQRSRKATATQDT